MPLHLHTLPLASAALPAVADWLLAQRRPEPHDLASILVLLPSQHACAQLGHILLDRARRPALILPQILTPPRLADRLARLQGAGVPRSLPDMALRHLLLAPRLAGLDWLRDRPEAAQGLAAELISLFDELRRAQREDLLLDSDGDDALLQHVETEAADMLIADLQRLRATWRCYREVLPQDLVDRRLAALQSARRQWPGKQPALVAAVHLGQPDQVLADLLIDLAAAGVSVHWLTSGAADPRSRLLLATYRSVQAAAHPLRGIRECAVRLGLEPPPVPAFDGDDLPTRLAALSEHRDQLAPGGPIELRPCRDPEHESRVVAGVVCATLAAAQAAQRPPPSIVVATGDRELAARIAAQLRDAGVDIDDSRGRPLTSMPAGRLLRAMLRTVATDWAYAPLLEVLTHPYVRISDPEARPGHAVQVLRLEASIRRSRQARRGLAALRSIAARDDDRHGEPRCEWSMSRFVSDVATRFAPLVNLAHGPASWEEAVGALAAVWSALAPDHLLGGDADPRHAYNDLGATAGLLDALTEVAPLLPPATLPEIAAAVNALLADPAFEVRPLSERYLPVRLMGLIEARLETADLLVLAGMGQDVFPGPLPRPLLLPDRLRRELGLLNRRQQAGLAAELFLRLMHVAPRMLITWPRERDGRPALPSPLVQRLMLAAPVEPVPADEPLLRRRILPDAAELAGREMRHRSEPEPVPAPRIRPPRELSHSALQMYRACPYQFLLAAGLGLRRVDPVEAVHTAADAGTLAHRVMQRWLEPTGSGWAALAEGDRPAALARLYEIGNSLASETDSGLPGAAVSLQSLMSLAPALVDFELQRAATWQPAVLEASFTVDLGQAAAWLSDVDAGHPALDMPDNSRDIVFKGCIDRVDRCRDGSAQAAVLDYKSGRLPSKSQVRDGRDLQIYLYALAVEAGTVAGLPAPVGGVWRLDHGAFYGLNRAQLALSGQPHLSDRELLCAGVRAILTQVLAIMDPEVPYALVPDWRAEDAAGQLPCRTCGFRGVCRLEERDTTPALAARLTALVTENPRRTS